MMKGDRGHSVGTAGGGLRRGIPRDADAMNFAVRTRFTDLAVAWTAAVAAMVALGTVVGQLAGGAWPSSAWGALASSALTVAPAALVAGWGACWWATRRRPSVEPLDVLGVGLVALPLVLAGLCVAAP